MYILWRKRTHNSAVIIVSCLNAKYSVCVVRRHTLHVHVLNFHMRVKLVRNSANHPCRSTLHGLRRVVYVFDLLLCSCVSHTYLCNGLKVALNNEIPVSTSLSFCILSLRGCACHAQQTLWRQLTYNIASTISSFSPVFYIPPLCK